MTMLSIGALKLKGEQFSVLEGPATSSPLTGAPGMLVIAGELETMDLVMGLR